MNGTQMTVASALAVLQNMPDLGVCSRDSALELLNQARERLFLERGFTPKITWCQPVGRLNVQCPPHCSSPAIGFRLPFGFTGIPSAWQDRQPVKFAPSWRDGPADSSRCGPCVELSQYENNSPTEFDLTPECPDHLWFEASACDAGKKFRLIGEGAERYDNVYTIPEGGGRYQTERLYSSIESVRLPALSGILMLGQCSGNRILSRYQPGETAPSYQTWILTKGSGCSLVVQAERGFVDLVDDLDIVEFSDKIILRSLARAIKLEEKGDKTPSDMQQIAAHEGRAMGYLSLRNEKQEKNVPLIMRQQTFSPRRGLE